MNVTQYKQCSECPPSAATHDLSLLQNDHCHNINKLLRQIIPYRQQNSVTALLCWSALACIFRVAVLRYLHGRPNSSGAYLFIILHQNFSLISCLFIKKRVLTSNSCNF